jgi:succinoglycan biosynthesis transport protein ExoP
MTGLEAPAGVAEGDDVTLDESRTETGEVTDRGLVQALAPGSRLVETLRVLRARVESLDAERRFRRIGVVAAAAREGTTLTALGLAAALARGGARRVLLLEAGLRAPAIESQLHLAAAPGLSDWLARGGVGPVPLRRVEPWGFSLLSGGTPHAEPAPLLESGHLSRLLEAIGRAFDFAVVDCPPLVPVADSVLVQDLLDGFLLVVRARRAPREQVLQAVSQLKPERLRGVVFNDLHEILARSHPLGPDHRG